VPDAPGQNVVPFQRPPGGLPASLQPASAQAGQGTAPQAKLGNMAAAGDKLKVAMQALQEALPAIPMGSPLHTEVLNTLKRLGSKLETGESNSAAPVQALLQMLRQAPQQNQMALLARMAPQQQAAAAAPALGGAGKAA